MTYRLQKDKTNGLGVVVDVKSAQDESGFRNDITQDLVSQKIRFINGDCEVTGDLVLELGEGFVEEDGIIVKGNLKVTGNIINKSTDYGPFLFVTGNVTAKNLIAGGSEVVVLGNVTVTGVIFGFYNHGRIKITGKTKAKAIIASDHVVELNSSDIEALTVSGSGPKITEKDKLYAEVIKKEYLKDPGGKYNPPGGFPVYIDFFEAILSDKPVFLD